MKGKWQIGSIKHEKTCSEQILYIDVLILQHCSIIYQNVLQIAFNIFKGIQQTQAKLRAVPASGSYGTWRWHQNWQHGLRSWFSAQPWALLCVHTRSWCRQTAAISEWCHPGWGQVFGSNLTPRTKGTQNSVVLVHTVLSHHDRQWGNGEIQVLGIIGPPYNAPVPPPGLCIRWGVMGKCLILTGIPDEGWVGDTSSWSRRLGEPRLATLPSLAQAKGKTCGKDVLGQEGAPKGDREQDVTEAELHSFSSWVQWGE